jgi:hypothetical protein
LHNDLDLVIMALKYPIFCYIGIEVLYTRMLPSYEEISLLLLNKDACCIINSLYKDFCVIAWCGDFL